jgi:Zn finger protein HypA/HybF involved in hydrogenase expression
MSDPNLPPGVTDRDLARYLDGPAKLPCMVCGLTLPSEQLDDDEVCETCRRERTNEDGRDEARIHEIKT